MPAIKRKRSDSSMSHRLCSHAAALPLPATLHDALVEQSTAETSSPSCTASSAECIHLATYLFGPKATFPDLAEEQYQCLSCEFVGIRDSGCDSFMSHSIMENHPLALLVRKKQIYCANCRDFIYTSVQLSGDSLRSSGKYRSSQANGRYRHHTNRQQLRQSSRRGLVNMGNTCYMNAVLQAFVHMPMLQHYFLVAKSHDTIICQQTRRQQRPSPICLGCELGAFMATVLASSTSSTISQSSLIAAGPIVPNSVLETFWSFAPSFIGTQQHDAHEFFIALLGGLHSHTHPKVFVHGGISPRFTIQGQSLCNCAVHQHFAGVLESQVQCCQCDRISTAFDPFLDLSLSLDDDKSKNVDKTLSLEDLLAKFTADEELRSINQVYCRQCAKYTNATKCLRLRTLPNVLVFHIKRLDFYKQRKLATYVNFPLRQLSLAAFRTIDHEKTTTKLPSKEPVASTLDTYDLMGVINHHGDSVDSGHYTAFVLDEYLDNSIKPQQHWLLFDDTEVSPVSEDTVLQSQA